MTKTTQKPNHNTPRRNGRYLETRRIGMRGPAPLDVEDDGDAIGGFLDAIDWYLKTDKGTAAALRALADALAKRPRVLAR